jgi:signal transduction histidine kinase
MSLREMVDRKKSYIIIIVSSTLFITYLHDWIFQKEARLIIIEELYYIPLFMGAMIFGLKGAILTYLLASALYLVYVSGLWTMDFWGLLDRLLHLLFSGAFVFLAGFLVDREKRRQKQFEKDRYLAGIGLVAAAIVHDLRNPLIAILGFTKRIQEGKGEMGTAAQVIIDEAQNMQRIVDGVLDLAKPIRLEIKEGDIIEVVNQACKSCRTKAEERGVNLSFNHPADPVNIVMDSFSVQRALINVINNAIESSSAGGNVAISMETEKNDVAVRIKDFGSGMDREALENIFIPFYSRKDTGTGLGMVIVKKVIEGHHGKIHIESHPGEGTEVTIRLAYKTN